jgi:hypothetical protein
VRGNLIYLLDADTLISADRVYYPLNRFPVFWRWLRHYGTQGTIKVPAEQYEEVVAGTGPLVDWLDEEESKTALLFDEEVDPTLVARVTSDGYAADLNEAELETIGRDPFLIAHGLVAPANRCVVSFEVSAPSKQRANRKVPDVCAAFGVRCVNLSLPPSLPSRSTSSSSARPVPGTPAATSMRSPD